MKKSILISIIFLFLFIIFFSLSGISYASIQRYVTIGEIKTLPVKIQNVGTADLIVTELNFIGSPMFLLNPKSPIAPLIIKPGGFVKLLVDYKPLALQEDKGILQILSNDLKKPEIKIPLSGRGVKAVKKSFLKSILNWITGLF